MTFEEFWAQSGWARPGEDPEEYDCSEYALAKSAWEAATKAAEERRTESDRAVTGKNFYGKDCPKGMVQVEFVGSRSEKHCEYGWKPAKSAFLDLYVDGHRLRVELGDFHDGNGQRRGLHIVTGLDWKVEQTAINAFSLFRDTEETDGSR